MDTFTVLMLTVLLMIVRLQPSDGRMNVLFLVADDMRPQLASYYGPDFPSPVHPNMHTPNLDKLASKSLLLKQAFVQQAVCSPSRTSLLTGRRPDTTHVYDLYNYFRDVGGNFTTIPEYFKDNGYASVGMGKIFHPGHASHNDDPISWNMPYFHAERYFESSNHSWMAVPDKLLKDKPLEDKQIADNAIKTLRQLAPDALSGTRSFFAAVGFHRPHLPFVFPESILQFYPNVSVRLPDNTNAPINMPTVAWEGNTEIRSYGDIRRLNYSGHINSTMPRSTFLELRRAYYCALTWTDLLVGTLLQELENLGLSNNTIVSFWGDHGWQLGEHGAWAKATNFELATHAPMMVHVPGMTDKGIETSQLTEFVDLFPTLVDAAGLPSMPRCSVNSSQEALCREGTSLLPLIKNPYKRLKKAAFSQYPRETKTRETAMGYTMRTEGFRYTEWAKFTYAPLYRPDWEKLYGVELYEHGNDPEENYNRAYDADYQDIRSKLSQQLHEGWRGSIIT